MDFRYISFEASRLNAEVTFRGEEVLTLRTIYLRLRDHWLSQRPGMDETKLHPVARFFSFIDEDEDPKHLERKFSVGNGCPDDILEHIQLYQAVALQDMAQFEEIADPDEKHAKIDPIFRAVEAAKGLWSLIESERTAALGVFLESDMPKVAGTLPTAPDCLPERF